MEVNHKNTLVELQQQIEYLSVSDRWRLMKWLIELLQPESQNSQPEDTKVNFEAVNQISHQIRSLPVLDNRSPDEIVGYNQFGGLD
jgi:hypothetical protein